MKIAGSEGEVTVTPALVGSKITGEISELLVWRRIHKESVSGVRAGRDHRFMRTGKSQRERREG